MTELGVSRAHMLGNPMGGFVAATLAAEHPQRVLTLGLSDAAGVTSATRSDTEKILDTGRNPFLPTDARGFREFYPQTMSRPPLGPGFVTRALGAVHVQRRDRYDEVFRNFHRVGLLDDRLAEVAAPTWVVWESDDRFVHPSAMDVWSGIGDVTSVVYDGIGPLPMIEAAGRTVAD